MSEAIVYTDEPGLGVDEFIDVLLRSTLAERRPVDDRRRIVRMLEQADIRLCARDAKGLLVGVARSLTDFSYCCYLSDLAVDVAWQRHGIGKELIHRTHAIAGLDATLILLSAPKAMSYYPHIGLTRSERAFTIAHR
ncbi:MAG: GNAT family N-acetyltransferase [Alphaproteobacteria bacterium]|nr:GNAT family N-acetyltransferase [Alphaproteobacteria bacterium]